MKVKDLLESKKQQIEPIKWPTNLAWRVKLKRYRNAEIFAEVRRDKCFAIPFRNWVGTYYSLLGKDISKIKYLPTEIIEIPDTALVADMSLADDVFDAPNKNLRDQAIDNYTKTIISYHEFKNNPYIFKNPEIMIDPAQVAQTSLKLTVTDILDKDHYPLLGVK